MFWMGDRLVTLAMVVATLVGTVAIVAWRLAP
jgi:hypothetical protein